MNVWEEREGFRGFKEGSVCSLYGLCVLCGRSVAVV